MCGIVFSLENGTEITDKDEWYQLVSLNAQRGELSLLITAFIDKWPGPHAQNATNIRHGSINMQFFSSVLHLRGDHVVAQPHEHDGNVLCWNGEVSSSLVRWINSIHLFVQVFEGMDIAATENDGVTLFKRLCDPDATVQDVLSTLEGPYVRALFMAYISLIKSCSRYAFVFYQQATQTVYFGRDPLGRRSLLIQRPEGGIKSLIVASVGTGKSNFEELPADSLFSISLTDVVNIWFLGFKSSDSPPRFRAASRL